LEVIYKFNSYKYSAHNKHSICNFKCVHFNINEEWELYKIYEWIALEKSKAIFYYVYIKYEKKKATN